MTDSTRDFVKLVVLVANLSVDDSRLADISKVAEGTLKQLQELRQVDLSEFEPATIYRPVEAEYEE